MATGKKGYRKGKAQQRTPHGRGGSSSKRHHSKPSPYGFDTPNFTLRDAAVHGNRTPSFWDSSNTLRAKRINFVSGGTTGASFEVPSAGIPDRPNANVIEPAVKSPISKSQAQNDAHPPQDLERSLQSGIESIALRSSGSSSENLHTPPASRPYSRTSHRSPSPTPSSSSTEIVVFQGRNPKRQPPKKAARNLTSRQGVGPTTARGRGDIDKVRPLSAAHTETRVAEANIDDITGVTIKVGTGTRTGLPLIGKANGAMKNSSNHDLDTAEASDKIETSDKNTEQVINELLRGQNKTQVNDGLPQGRARKKGRNRRARPQKKERQFVDSDNDVPEDVLDDYIENMKASGAIEDTWQANNVAEEDSEDEWGSAELEDFNSLPTSETFGEVVSQVLSKRERSSGIQYLVVWDGQSTDEARWVHEWPLLSLRSAAMPVSELEDRLAAKLWNEQKMEEIQMQEEPTEKFIIGTEDESDDDSEGAEEATSDEDDACDDDDDLHPSDEEDLNERRRERMTDEHIARLFQKQEELGITDDELVLFNEDDDLDGANPVYTPLHRQSRGGKGTRRERLRHEAHGFDGVHDDSLDAELNGDDYGDWYWDRPSLIARASNSAHPPAAFGVSDPDLARTLSETWERDRNKKKARKQERQELREQGLLGRGGKKRRSTSHTDGISMDEFRDELDSFLNSDKSQLALPPLDKRTRKIVHIIGHRFGLKTQSKGAGHSRFPVLYKSRRTQRFNAQEFDKLEGALARRIGHGHGPSKKGGKKGEKTTANVMEGQLVGAGASEIGARNKGHALLEKMGWTKGTALGAVENKGIIIPVDSIVKKGRTGIQ